MVLVGEKCGPLGQVISCYSRRPIEIRLAKMDLLGWEGSLADMADILRTRGPR